jgi:hypothetical protein
MKTVAWTSTERWWPIEPPCSSAIGERSSIALNAVLDALSVEINPRYQPDERSTFCNIFVSDVMRCMGQDIPHWVDGSGMGADPNHGGAEMTANAMHCWMASVPARRNGWCAMGPCTAQENANLGRPTVVTWPSPPGKIGHVAVVTPAAWSVSRGVMIANVGSTTFRRGSVARGFGSRDVYFWGAP